MPILFNSLLSYILNIQLKKKTCLALFTFGACHDQSRVRKISLPILSAVHIGAPALYLNAVCTDGGVYGHSIRALWFLGSTVALYLTAFGITVGRLYMRDVMRDH